MSDFFGGLTGGNIRFTDARINGDGPLPTSLSGPEGIHGDADGQYNFNDSLLSGITPYAYGQGRMGSDRNYQHIPHRKQFSVPPLWLPEPEHHTESLFQVSHQVDMGDIAFIMNVQHKQFILMPGPHKYVSQGEDHTLPQWNVFCNICTVNYLLAGMYNFVSHYVRSPQTLDQKHAWYRLFVCFSLESHLKHTKAMFIKEEPMGKNNRRTLLMLRSKWMLQHILRHHIIPIGICSMSEKQGGQHEVGLKPVQAATNFFTTLTVDGQNRDLVNIWRAIDVDAGDFLILRLEFFETEVKKFHFVLNHYYKDTVTRSMKMHDKNYGIIQLVPRVNKIDVQKKQPDPSYHVFEAVVRLKCSQHGWTSSNVLKHLVAFVTEPMYNGYWHIGQTYTKKQSFTTVQVPVNDSEMTKGQLLQINFAPVWKGSTPGFKNLEAHVKFCPAYAMQKLLFADAPVSTFVDAEVFTTDTSSDTQRSIGKRYRRNAPSNASVTSAAPALVNLPATNAIAEAPVLDVNAQQAAATLLSAPLATGIDTVLSADTQQAAKDTSKDTAAAEILEFEAEMETVLRAVTDKGKAAKTKSKAASNP